MCKKVLLLSLTLLVAGWAMAPSGAEAISCISIPDVTALGPAGCDLGGLTFSNFTVSASAGFSSATVGLGNNSTATPSVVNLLFQVVTVASPVPPPQTPPAMGPGDVLLSYAVTTAADLRLTGIDVTNNAILGPVTVAELACRVPFNLGGTCAPLDRLAALAVGPGQSAQMAFPTSVDFAFLHKDIIVGGVILPDGNRDGGVISDFSNSHSLEPVPEPATLLLLGSTLAGIGLAYRKRRGSRFNP